MYNTSSVVYGLKHQARCMVPQLGETEKHNFFVGTNTVRDSNEIHWIEFREDSNDVFCQSVFSHPAPIWAMATTAAQKDLLVTSYAEGDVNKATIWKINSSDSSSSSSSNSTLSKAIDLSGHKSRVKSLAWSTEDCTNLVTLTDDSLKLWKLDSTGANFDAQAAPVSFSGSFAHSEAGVFDPHHAGQFVSVHDTAIKSWDFRTSKEVLTIPDAHAQTIRDVDYNPNKLHNIITAGNDRRIKFWDLRRPKQPIKILTGHTHWCFAAKYNRFHDQLLCSGGSDAQVNLWSVLSISSAPLGDLENHSADSMKDGDKLIRTYDENEESVYAVAWSAADAWIFAALSYDGRVVVHHVPAPEKYKILL